MTQLTSAQPRNRQFFRLLTAAFALSAAIVVGSSTTTPRANAQAVGLARISVERIVEGEPPNVGGTGLYRLDCSLPIGPFGNLRNADGGVNQNAPGNAEYGGFPAGVPASQFDVYAIVNGIAIIDHRYTGPIPAALPHVYGTAANIDGGLLAPPTVFMLATYDDTNGLLISPNGPGRSIFVGRRRFFDVRTDPSVLVGGDQLGTPANVGSNAVELARLVNEITVRSRESARADVRTALRNGPFFRLGDYPRQVPVNFVEYGSQTFRLLPGQRMTFGTEVFPKIRMNSQCEMIELDNAGASATFYSSTVTDPTTFIATQRPGIVGSDGLLRSQLTLANGLETITVTNRFAGTLIVSKAVTGDPRSNIATFEISVVCDRLGAADTFLLKDRQSKVYTNVLAGTTCVVSERRSDGAFVSYTDNDGPQNDGRVTVRSIGSTCATNCSENVIVTNDYTKPPVPPTTTTTILDALPEGAPPRVLIQLGLDNATPSTSTRSPGGTHSGDQAPGTSEAPAIAAEPAQAVLAEPTFTG